MPGEFGGFPTFLLGKTIHAIDGERIKTVQLTKNGGGYNDTLEILISTSDDETNWSQQELIPFGVPTVLTAPGKWVRVLVAGAEGTTLESKDAYGRNIGVEIDILEVIAV